MAEPASDEASDVIESTSRAALLILLVETVVAEFAWCAVVNTGVLLSTLAGGIGVLCRSISHYLARRFLVAAAGLGGHWIAPRSQLNCEEQRDGIDSLPLPWLGNGKRRPID
jgi:hypothetical protein